MGVNVLVASNEATRPDAEVKEGIDKNETGLTPNQQQH
jgi:hypothetical protein